MRLYHSDIGRLPVYCIVFLIWDVRAFKVEFEVFVLGVNLPHGFPSLLYLYFPSSSISHSFSHSYNFYICRLPKILDEQEKHTEKKYVPR